MRQRLFQLSLFVSVLLLLVNGVTSALGWQARLQECNLGSIEVDDLEVNTNGAISGSVSGLSPCNAVLEVHNERSYWVNLSVTPIGGAQATPVGGDTNFYATHSVLGSNETVRYDATFTSDGQSVIALLDPTPVHGQTAWQLNFIQLLIDAMSIAAPPSSEVVTFSLTAYTEYLPEIVNAFGTMPNLNRAANAIFQVPPQWSTLSDALDDAWSAGEFELLRETLLELGVEVSLDVFEQFFEEPGQFLAAAEVTWRDGNALYEQMTQEPAGFIGFRAEGPTTTPQNTTELLIGTWQGVEQSFITLEFAPNPSLADWDGVVRLFAPEPTFTFPYIVQDNTIIISVPLTTETITLEILNLTERELSFRDERGATFNFNKTGASVAGNTLPPEAHQALVERIESVFDPRSYTIPDWRVASAQRAPSPQNWSFGSPPEELWCVVIDPPITDWEKFPVMNFLVERTGLLWKARDPIYFLVTSDTFLRVGCTNYQEGGF